MAYFFYQLLAASVVRTPLLARTRKHLFRLVNSGVYLIKSMKPEGKRTLSYYEVLCAEHAWSLVHMTMLVLRATPPIARKEGSGDNLYCKQDHILSNQIRLFCHMSHVVMSLYVAEANSVPPPSLHAKRR